MAEVIKGLMLPACHLRIWMKGGETWDSRKELRTVFPGSFSDKKPGTRTFSHI